MNGFKLDLNDLAKYTRSIVIIIVVIIIIIVIIKIFKKSFKKLSVENTYINMNNVTVSEQDIVTYANELYLAMKGIGTNEQKIYDIFSKLNTKDDYNYLFKTFAVKDGKTLKEWIYSELDGNELARLNEITKYYNVSF